MVAMATTNSTPSCRPASTWSSCPQGTGVHRSAPVGGTGPGLAVIVEAMAIKLDRVDAVGEHGGVLTSAGVRPVRPLTRTRRGAGRQTMEQPRPRRNRSAQRLAVGPTTSPRGAGRIGSGFGAGRSLGVGRRRVRRIRAGRTDRRPTHGVTATVVHPGPDAVVHLPGRRGRASAAPPAARPTGPSSRRRRELARQRAVRPGDRPRRRPAAHRRNAAAARGADPARPMPPPGVDRGVCTGRSWRGPVAARTRLRHHSGSRGASAPEAPTCAHPRRRQVLPRRGLGRLRRRLRDPRHPTHARAAVDGDLLRTNEITLRRTAAAGLQLVHDPAPTRNRHPPATTPAGARRMARR